MTTIKNLLLEREDEADLEIQNDQIIDLDGDGIEHFISRKATWKLNVQGKELLLIPRPLSSEMPLSGQG